MKKSLLPLALFLFSGISVFAQEDQESESFTPSGEAFGKVFWNYHYDLNDETKSSFELQRTYLGYAYDFSEKLSAKITLDGAKASGASEYTVFVKIAQLDWQFADPLKLSVGMIGLKQFNDQEKFWGYRYLYKSFQDEFGFGSSADLGANLEIKALEALKFNVFMLNGEGYTSPQDDFGMHKYGANAVYTPDDGVLLKAYYSANFYKYDKYGNDSIIADTSTIQNLAFFAGYNGEKFRIGAEYDLMLNGKKYKSPAEDHNLTGIAVYGTYIINNKFEVFANYMNLSSNQLDGSDEAWNVSKDGHIILGGVQYAPVRGVKMALNYRTYLYDDEGVDPDSRVYLNFEFTF